MDAVVVAVSRCRAHRFSKHTASDIRLLAGLGVEGDAHAGVTVRHRSRVAADPTAPNLRQVHLLAAELHDELVTRGFDVGPGQLGENVTTRGVDLLALARGTLLRLGAQAVVEVTGLRNPCQQLEGVRPGLQSAVLDRNEDGELGRRAGVVGVVVASREVRAGSDVSVDLLPSDTGPLAPV